jgi:hypothetical protein
MQQILKRLELIKTSIDIADYDVIALQIDKLMMTPIVEEEIKKIITLIKDHNYMDASIAINNYLMAIYSKKSIEWYAVSLVDILGQKNELEKLNNKNLSPMEVQEIFDQTYKNVKSLRSTTITTFNILQMKKTIRTDNLDANEIEVSSFSDLIVSYVSLRNDINLLSWKGIYYLLLANGAVFLQMLSDGIVIRGGVEIGRGLSFKNFGSYEIYGSALLNAYKIESSRAIFPRIVIGTLLHEHLLSMPYDRINDESDKINLEFVKLCSDLIKEDCDGEYILDYLADPFKSLEHFNELAIRSKQFVEKTMKSFNINHEVSRKYSYLKKYFENNGIK